MKRALAALTALVILGQALPSGAANYNFVNDIPVSLTGSGIGLTVLAGSKADSLVIGSTTLAVTVAAAETFTLRYPGPNPGKLPNDGGLSECNLVSGNNEAVVTGPATVTFTPNTDTCVSAATGGGSSTVNLIPSVSLSQPNGGETLTAGSNYLILWSAGGGVTAVDIYLSTDGGNTYPTGVYQGAASSGAYNWTVPDLRTANARLRIRSTGGSVSDASDGLFWIVGPVTNPASTTTPAPPPSPTPGTTTGVSPTSSGTTTGVSPNSSATPSAEMSAGEPEAAPTAPGKIPEAFTEADFVGMTGGAVAPPDISSDKELPVAGDAVSKACAGYQLIKLPDDGDPKTQYDTTVYYCGRDGKRYVFPDPKTYFTWYSDFSAVKIVTAKFMASIKLGGNVTRKPGTRLVKVQTDPKVYAVEPGGLLRPIPDEATALALFGNGWNRKIDDLSDAFFSDYLIGLPLPAK